MYRLIYRLLVLVAVAIPLYVLALLTALEQERSLGIQAELQFYSTLQDFDEQVLVLASRLITQQQVVIQYQRKVIEHLGRTPCAERSLMVFRRDLTLESILKGKGIDPKRNSALEQTAGATRP